MDIRAVEDAEFEKALGAAMRDPAKAQDLSGLVAYMNMGRGRRVYMLHARK